MDLKCKVDFSDVDAFFNKGKQEVDKAMAEVGENAVEYARQNGDYPNRTGKLRSSNHYQVDEDGLLLYNDATSPNGEPYAATVESKGYDVLSGAALEAERELKEIFE